MLTREDIAWAAGFFEGEGSTYLAFKEYANGSKLYFPRLKISQNADIVFEEFYSDVLERFQKIYPQGYVHGPYTGRTNRSPYFSYTVNKFEGVQYIMSSMWTFLGHVKRNQYRKVILETSFRRPR
jgi:hypothetical protein